MGLTVNGCTLCLEQIKKRSRWITILRHDPINGSFEELLSERVGCKGAFDISNISLCNTKEIRFMEDNVDMGSIRKHLLDGVLYSGVSEYKKKREFLFIGDVSKITIVKSGERDGVACYIGPEQFVFAFDLSSVASVFERDK
jgi:hypothetical protein